MSTNAVALWQTVKLADEAVEVQARPGTAQTQNQPFILLQDVQDIFPSASRLQCGNRALGFMVDSDGNRLHPIRVPYMEGVILDVIISHSLRSSSAPDINSTINAITKERSARPARSSHQRTRQRQQQQLEQLLPKELIEQERLLQQELLNQEEMLQRADTKPQPERQQEQQQQQPPLPTTEKATAVPPLRQRRPARRQQQQTAIEQKRDGELLQKELHLKEDLSQQELPQPAAQPLRQRRQPAKRQQEQQPQQPQQQILDETQTADDDVKVPVPVPTTVTPAQQRRLVKRQQEKERQQQQERQNQLTAPPLLPPPVPPSDTDSFLLQYQQGSRLSTDAAKTKYRKSVMLYQTFLQHIRAGQTEQANVVKEDFRQHFNNLEAEMAKNQDLQERMIDMQHTMLEMQQRSLDRLAIIQNRVQAILIHRYELHEYPIPRLFIILPRDASQLYPDNISRNKFRLHFLCECGEHTKSTQSKIQHHIHLAKHEGYDLERPAEFFRRYGHYVLKLLQMLKYGVAVAGFAVPAMVPLRPGESIRATKNPFDNHSIEPAVSQTIDFLQAIADMNQLGTPGVRHEEDMVEALEGADLKRLTAFLKGYDEDRELGNLYRVVTSEGHVKWVCLDHYRETYNTLAMRELEDMMMVNGGAFDEHHGRVEISLSSPIVATQFYRALERAKFVQELKVKLQWEITYNDAKALRDAIHRSNVSSLELSCTASNSAAELLNRNKRAEPLWQILNNSKIRSFTLSGYSGFWRRSALEAHSNELRVLKITDEIDWKKDYAKVVELLQMSPHLTDLTLGCLKINEAYKALRQVASDRCPLSKLTLEASKDEVLIAQFEQDQALVSMDLVLPSLAAYTHLLKSTDCISSLHISSRTNGYSDCAPLIDLISRNRNLTELKVSCYLSEFQPVYEAIRSSVTSNRSSRLKKVCLYRGENQLYTTDIRTPHLVSLELMQLKVNDGVLSQLLVAFGSKLTKLRIDSPKWQPVHSEILFDAIHAAPGGSRLTHLYQTCAEVDEGVLRELSGVINRSNLIEHEIIVDQSFKLDPQRAMYWVDFITWVGGKLTSLILSCPEPNEWIEALSNANFPAMERVSFGQVQKRASQPEQGIYHEMTQKLLSTVVVQKS
ncbi:hypothetical protein BGZ99_007083 [Dissophora globulifera]|uniref:Uncharacterized protein n=1 Tax=Dissophora globulifera TaxID=979702 RepID=A0A9P6RUG9_9FUNG|nr:hypothetical protein BGZ99_007083 [Dissophora globulifera]